MTVGEENRMYIKNDALKTQSPLHRAQTLKSDALRSCSNNHHEVFRPVDLVCGEVVGTGAFGDVVKVKFYYLLFHSVNARIKMLR